MGVVYRARHSASDRAVALKTVKAPAVSRLDGIRREIHALTRIRHPGIVRILDHGVHLGLPWYAMDLLEGESLRQFNQRIWSSYQPPSALPSTLEHSLERLSETELLPAESSSALPTPPLPLRRPSVDGPSPAAAGQLEVVLKLVRRVCETLAYLHGEGFANCDLKPDNVLLVGNQPIVIDFGLAARHPGFDSRESLEARRALSGTVPYMSPEQVRGELLDARSDLYAVGCMLFELLVGSSPFLGSPRAILNQHLSTPPVAPSGLVKGLSPELENIVLRLLSKDPSQRFGYADEVAGLLADLAGDVHRLPNYPPAGPYLYRSRLVGRGPILADLTLCMQQAARGKGSLVLLGGESGVGKTRVAMELLRAAAELGMQVVTGEAPAVALDSAAPVGLAPLHTLRPLLQAVADRCFEGGPEVTDSLLGARRSVLAQYEPLLAQIPARDALVPPMPVSVRAARDRLFKYLAETLTALAERQPLLLMLDDIGWADELSATFLRSLDQQHVQSMPAFILCTYRSEDLSDGIRDLARSDGATWIELPRLDVSAVRSMISDMLAMPAPPDAFVRSVERETEGNPFFVAEYLRAAVNERLLFRDQNSAWRVAWIGGADAEPRLPLPGSVRELVARRLQRLSPQAQHTALALAVVDREVESDVLLEVAELSDSAGIEVLDELLRRQILEEVGDSHLRFAHDKLREVSYSVASPERRRALHGRAAFALEARLAARPLPSRHWAILGHHFAAAGHCEEAARYLKLAGDHARATHANADAILRFRDAIQQVDQLLLRLNSEAEHWEGIWLQLSESFADVLALVGRRDEARSAYEGALGRFPMDDCLPRARVYRKLGKTWETQHQHENALRSYQLAQHAAEAGPAQMPPVLRDEWLHVHIEQLWVHYWLNRVEEMDELIAALRPVVEAHGSSERRAQFFQSQMQLNLRRDRYVVSEQTLAFARSALGACQAAASSEELPMAQFNYGFALLFNNSIDAAEQELQAALALAVRAGDSAQQARCLTYLALTARMSDRIDETASRAERLLLSASAAGMRDYLGAARANQAWVCLRRGDDEAALVQAQLALQTWGDLTGYVYPFRWMALLPLLELALMRGDVATGVSYVEPLLNPSQQYLHGGAADALANASSQWALGQVDTARSSLQAALEHLNGTGYR